MKLYTEEQVISVFEKYGNMSAINARNILDLSESIELPSDEEIEQTALDFAKKYRATTYEISALIIGAKYVKDKIQGGNK
jgi:elongation factor P hydroxylase